jgi:hypothetical protein
MLKVILRLDAGEAPDDTPRRKQGGTASDRRVH